MLTGLQVLEIARITFLNNLLGLLISIVTTLFIGPVQMPLFVGKTSRVTRLAVAELGGKFYNER